MKNKGQKAITLVVLIITIVVSLILVGISVKVLINSDIIGKTQVSTSIYTQADVKDNLTVLLGKKEIKEYSLTRKRYFRGFFERRIR